MNHIGRFWNFLKQDNWKSWIVSIALMIIIIKFILFPVLSLITGTPLPLVIVESCSMYHPSKFSDFWNAQGAWYEQRGINYSQFSSFPMKNGINKGDIILVLGRTELEIGDIIIFEGGSRYPLIHRVVSLSPLATKGDNNNNQISSNIEGISVSVSGYSSESDSNIVVDETNIPIENVMGEAKAKVIPYLGWIKLIFFEPLKPKDQRGLCR